MLFEFENVSPLTGRQRPEGALAPSGRGLAKIFDFRLGECPKYQRHPLSHGVRRDSSPRGDAKSGFAAFHLNNNLPYGRC